MVVAYSSFCFPSWSPMGDDDGKSGGDWWYWANRA